jgi:hypothetical protein
MFRITLRDLFWLTLLAAVLFAWYLEYRSDALARHRDAQEIQYLKQQVATQPAVRVVSIPRPRLPQIPGNWDYQFPPSRRRSLEEKWLQQEGLQPWELRTPKDRPTTDQPLPPE